MEIREVSSLSANAHNRGEGTTVTPLYPSDAWGQGLVAVDLWEIAPGGVMASHAHAEEHVLFVLSGQGHLTGGSQEGPVSAVRENTVVYIAPHEAHQLRNTGNAPLRVLISTPMLVRSERAYGIAFDARAGRETSEAQRQATAAIDTPARTAERPERTEPVSVPPAPDGAQAYEAGGEMAANIAGIVRKASELKDHPKPERRRPAPAPEEAPQQQDEAQPEEDEEQSNLMELFVAFDGGIRGSAAQGFGRYLVQSPGRKPVIKAAEFADNYTPAQAQYESLIEALRYIIARLEATGRSAEQVQLDIRSGNESVVNGLLGTMKVKEPALRKRQEQALELLAHFADWRIEWHSPEESARLLG